MVCILAGLAVGGEKSCTFEGNVLPVRAASNISTVVLNSNGWSTAAADRQDRKSVV